MNALNKNGREAIIALRAAAFLVFAILLLSAPLAQSVPITIAITGKVTYLNVGTAFNDILVGDPFSGIYTYDSATLDSDPSPLLGTYQHNSPFGISLILGGYEFKTDPTQMSGQFSVSIEDNSFINTDPIDSYSIDSYQNNIVNGFQVSHIGWQLVDFSHSVFSSDALPMTVPILNQWNYNATDISILGEHGGEYRILGTVEQAVQIPEPTTSTILLTMGTFLLRRKR